MTDEARVPWSELLTRLLDIRSQEDIERSLLQVAADGELSMNEALARITQLREIAAERKSK